MYTLIHAKVRNILTEFSLEDSIKEDLALLRESTWIKKETRLIGLKYDTHTGLLHEVQDLKP